GGDPCRPQRPPGGAGVANAPDPGAVAPFAAGRLADHRHPGQSSHGADIGGLRAGWRADRRGAGGDRRRSPDRRGGRPGRAPDRLPPAAHLGPRRSRGRRVGGRPADRHGRRPPRRGAGCAARGLAILRGSGARGHSVGWTFGHAALISPVMTSDPLNTPAPDSTPQPRPQNPVRLVLIGAVALVGAYMAAQMAVRLSSLWMLIFGSVLVAVILRSIADPLVRRTPLGDGAATLVAVLVVIAVLAA